MWVVVKCEFPWAGSRLRPGNCRHGVDEPKARFSEKP
jgi:hypothetical protein